MAGVLQDHFDVRRDVDTVNLLIGHVAVDPLNLRSQLAEHAARLLRDGLKLFSRKLPRPRDVTLNQILRHCQSPS